MAVTPEATRSSVCARSGARCRYVKSICPRRSFLRSAASGSFTFTINSAFAKMSSAFAADLGAGGFVVVVGDASALPRARLDHHAMALGGELAYRRGHEPDAVLVVLDLLGNADEHGGKFLLSLTVIGPNFDTCERRHGAPVHRIDDRPCRNALTHHLRSRGSNASGTAGRYAPAVAGAHASRAAARRVPVVRPATAAASPWARSAPLPARSRPAERRRRAAS